MFSPKSLLTTAIIASIAALASPSAFGGIIELARTTVEMKGPGPHGTTTIVPGKFDTAAFTFEVNTSFGGETEAPSAGWIVGPITPADIGRTFILDAVTNSSFPDIAARLTDGDPGTYGLGEDVLFFGINAGGAGGGDGTWEHYVFHDNPIFGDVPDGFELNTRLFVTLPTTIDLHGAVLTSIVMRIDSLALFHVDNSTAIRGGYTMSFFGAPPVPEPSPSVAIGLAIALTSLARRRQLVWFADFGPYAIGKPIRSRYTST